jgi:hypothetical protein
MLSHSFVLVRKQQVLKVKVKGKNQREGKHHGMGGMDLFIFPSETFFPLFGNELSMVGIENA